MENASTNDERTLLAIYAHPDDEVLGPGGSLARYADAGARVVLIVATRGEAGEIQRPGTATPESLPKVREEELLCSARSLGVSQVIFLNYRDSGMAGSADNEHPRAFINAPPAEVVPRLVGLIREMRPDIILTFEPYGAYGHPDHVAVNRHTVAAFQAAGDPDRYPAQGPAWQPWRLFYPILPSFVFEEMKQQIAARGGDTSGYDELIDGPPGQNVWPDEELHAVLDVSAYVEQKWEAWNCHRTQFGPGSRFRRLPEQEMKELLSTEYFALALPAPPDGLHLTDLFEPLPEAAS